MSPCTTPNFCRRKRLNSGRFSSRLLPCLRSAGHHLQSHGKCISLPLLVAYTPTLLLPPFPRMLLHSTSRARVWLWMPSQPAWPPRRAPLRCRVCVRMCGRLCLHHKGHPSMCTEDSLLHACLPDARPAVGRQSRMNLVDRSFPSEMVDALHPARRLLGP